MVPPATASNTHYRYRSELLGMIVLPASPPHGGRLCPGELPPGALQPCRPGLHGVASRVTVVPSSGWGGLGQGRPSPPRDVARTLMIFGGGDVASSTAIAAFSQNSGGIPFLPRITHIFASGFASSPTGRAIFIFSANGARGRPPKALSLARASRGFPSRPVPPLSTSPPHGPHMPTGGTAPWDGALTGRQIEV